jgi:hypothetical protein
LINNCVVEWNPRHQLPPWMRRAGNLRHVEESDICCRQSEVVGES